MLAPVGSMIIANAMNASAQAAERFRADVTAHAGQVEAGLALGADPAVTVAPYVQSAVYARYTRRSGAIDVPGAATLLPVTPQRLHATSIYSALNSLFASRRRRSSRR
jgi:ABC-type iron transport system FetAB permease component